MPGLFLIRDLLKVKMNKMRFFFVRYKFAALVTDLTGLRQIPALYITNMKLFKKV